MLFYLLAQ